jgi:hypothetical protein
MFSRSNHNILKLNKNNWRKIPIFVYQPKVLSNFCVKPDTCFARECDQRSSHCDFKSIEYDEVTF